MRIATATSYRLSLCRPPIGPPPLVPVLAVLPCPPGGFENPGVDPSSPGLVAYWRFDEGSGYRVKDSTGHGHDLTILQEPQWVVSAAEGREGERGSDGEEGRAG